MKAAMLSEPTPVTAEAPGRAAGTVLESSGSRILDYVQLTKPRISVLVLFTVGVGAILASRGFPDPLVLLHTLLGTALVASGASALNQLLERHTDARMQRTENRPLPAGRLSAAEVCVFGVLLGVVGTTYL